MSNQQIKVTGWHITCHGDDSVGIFDGHWDLEGEMFFDEREHLENFREKVKEAFSWCADEACLSVETFEEIEDRVKEEDKQMRSAFRADQERDRTFYSY